MFNIGGKINASDDDPNAPTNAIIGPRDGTTIATRPKGR